MKRFKIDHFDWVYIFKYTLEIGNRWENKWKPADAIEVSTFHFSLALAPQHPSPDEFASELS